MQRVQSLPPLEPDPHSPGQLHPDPAFSDVGLLDGNGLGLLELLLAVPVSRFGDHERLVVLVQGITLLKFLEN